LPNERTREQHKPSADQGKSHFAALRELETKLTSAAPALEDLHANSRALFRRDRDARENGVFRLHPRHPQDT
jgi:hypothetical protein